MPRHAGTATVAPKARTRHAAPRHRAAFGPGFGRLWAATAASGLGDGTRIAALAVYAAALTDDPFQVALVGVAGKVPWTLIGPFAGTLVDRLDRVRTLWICDLARALVMGALVLLIVTDRVGIAALAVASFLLTSIATLADNLSQALVADLVGGRGLDTANSRLIGGQLVCSEFLGAPLGTALFVLGRPLPFALDTLTFALSAVLVFGIRIRTGAGPPGRTDGPRTRLTVRTVLADTGEGLRWLWRHHTLRTVCALTGLMNFSVVAVMATAVLYALDELGIGEGEYGVLLGVLAVGGLTGLALAPAAVRLLGRGRVLRLSFALCPVPFLIAAGTSNPLLAAGTLACVGASISLTTVVTTSLRQELVPAGLFGRVNGGYRLVINGLSPLGGLVGGELAARFGLRSPFLLAAALTAAVTVVAVLRLPRGALDATTAGPAVGGPTTAAPAAPAASAVLDAPHTPDAPAALAGSDPAAGPTDPPGSRR